MLRTVPLRYFSSSEGDFLGKHVDHIFGDFKFNLEEHWNICSNWASTGVIITKLLQVKVLERFQAQEGSNFAILEIFDEDGEIFLLLCGSVTRVVNPVPLQLHLLRSASDVEKSHFYYWGLDLMAVSNKQGFAT